MPRKFPSKDEQDRVRIELGGAIAEALGAIDASAPYAQELERVAKGVLGVAVTAYWLGYNRGAGAAGADDARAKIAKRKAKRGHK
jgi:hypothetical protein